MKEIQKPIEKTQNIPEFAVYLFNANVSLTFSIFNRTVRVAL